MKYSDTLWIEGLAQKSLAPHVSLEQPSGYLCDIAQLFLDELCYLVYEYATKFNELVANSSEDLSCHILTLGQPATGMVLLKENDKLVIQCIGHTIHARMVTVTVEQEIVYKSLQIIPHNNDFGTVSWVCSATGQRLTPELVAKEHLSPFLVYGCQPKPTQTMGPRLVVIGGQSHAVSK